MHAPETARALRALAQEQNDIMRAEAARAKRQPRPERVDKYAELQPLVCRLHGLLQHHEVQPDDPMLEAVIEHELNKVFDLISRSRSRLQQWLDWNREFRKKHPEAA